MATVELTRGSVAELHPGPNTYGMAGPLFSRTVLGSVLLLGCACSASSLRPPEQPEDLRESRAPSERKRKPSRLVAPPPAYGNKIVGTPEPPPHDVARRGEPSAG